MKYIFTLFVFLTAHYTFAQKGEIYNRIARLKEVAKPKTVQPFVQSLAVKSNHARTSFESKSIFFTVNQLIINKLATDKQPLVELTFPINADKSISLELMPTEILTPDFKLYMADNSVAKINKKAAFYQGIVKGSPNSLATVSIIDGEINCQISDETGNHRIQKSKDGSGDYLYSNESDLEEKPNPFTCNTQEPLGYKLVEQNLKAAKVQNTNCKVVRVYFEIDSTMYAALGSNNNNALNYLYTMFIQVQTIYANIDVPVRLYAARAWNTKDPYLVDNTIDKMLTRFASYPPPFNYEGELRILLSTRNMNGGIAYVGELCSQFLGCGVCTEMGVLARYPNYSWAVNVVAHEMGHVFGSPHTHSCSWAGGPIDNCATPEYNCSPGPTPAPGTGSIMSYCNNTPTGINFSYGFGPRPGSLIRSAFLGNSNCFVVNDSQPTGLFASDITINSTFLSWISNSGSTSFTLQYKKTSETTWQTISPFLGSIYILSNLIPNTQYDWKVKGECSFDYSAVSTFTTRPEIYCTPTYANSGCSVGVGLASVTLNDIVLHADNNCTSTTFNYYPTPVGKLILNSANEIEVSYYGTANMQNITIWVDFNRNYTFEDTEVIYISSRGNAQPFSDLFTVSQYGQVGTNFRMRVLCKNGLASTYPCNAYTYGETEDYLVDVCAAPLPPTVIPSYKVQLCGPSVSLSTSGCTGTLMWNFNPLQNTPTFNATQTGIMYANCINACGTSYSGSTQVVACCTPNQTTKSGLWNDETVWSCGVMPWSTETANINTGHIIQVPTGNYLIKNISNKGQIKFNNGANILFKTQ